jgi:hypothetical protein
MRLETAILAIPALVGIALADPQPGDVFKEFRFDGGVNLCKQGLKRDQADFQISVDDLQGAVKAEVTGYFHTGHIGTSERMIQVNGGQKVPLPTAEIPRPNADCYFRYTFGRPSAEIPLKDLKTGANTFTFSVGPQTCYAFNWPCWGFHTFILRVYYDASRLRPDGRIVAPAGGGGILNETLAIHTEVRSPDSPVRSVEVLGYYYDYPFEGSGKYLDWHYMIKEQGTWSGFIGRTTAAPHRVTWDTRSIPDQEGPIRLTARITDARGISYMTPAVENLSLVRKRRSVRMYKAADVPENFMSRIGRTMKCRFEPIHEDLSQAVGAQVASIIPVGHLEGQSLSMCGLNDLQLRQYTALGNYRTDFFYDPYMPIGLGALKAGVNEFFIYSNTKGHMTEVCWPGPALLVSYDLTLPRNSGRESRPTYPPDSGPYYDTESLRYQASQEVTLVALDRDRAHLLKPKGPDDFIEFAMHVPKAGTYHLKTGYFRHKDNGPTQLSVDGVDHGPPWDQSSNAEKDEHTAAEVDLGMVRFPSGGDHRLRLRPVGKTQDGSAPNLTISYFYLDDQEKPSGPPEAPTDLVAIPIDRTVIQLKWKDNARNETQFTIERRVNGGPWAQIGQVPRNTTMFVNTGLRESVLYVYRVRASNALGYSPYCAGAAASGFRWR